MANYNIENYYEYIMLIAEDIAKATDSDVEAIKQLLQKRLNPFEPKPKDVFSPVKF